MSKRVVITGMGILTALGRGISDTTDALRSGKSGISKITSFATDRYETNTGGEVKEAFIDKDFWKDRSLYLDRASYLVYTACKDALLNASLNIDGSGLLEASVFMGTTLGGMLSGQKFHREYLLGKNKENRALVLRDHLACSQTFSLAQRFGFIGETLTLNNACTSSLSAVGLAFRRLRSGQISIAIAGGFDVMSEFTFAGFSSLQLITKEKCRPFDKNRSGLVLGEGAGILVLEEMNHALNRGADIIAEIIGYGQTSDAYHLTKPDPEARGACNAIAMAVKEAGISVREIGYINAHGTGTLANDPMEAKAINMALGDYGTKVPISSIKPMIGHTLGGAGAVEVVISVIAMKNNLLPVNLNYNTPDPDCRLNIISGHSRNEEIKTVLSNSFGFGGSNGAILLNKIEK